MRATGAPTRVRQDRRARRRLSPSTRQIPSVPAAGETATELLTAGAELSELFAEVVRRRGELTLAQYRTLAALRGAVAREPWELARAVQVSSPHMTSVLDQLVRLGLVERRVDPADRRRRRVVLTPAGRGRLRQVSPHVLALEAGLLESILTERERAVLTDLLRRLRVGMAEVAVSDGLPSRSSP
jgi:DNA-binding MarR family transcriptional regulator